MHFKDQPLIWVHPLTGDYKIPPTNDVEMPLRYKMQGYEERRFNSYMEHARWCASKNLVNHASEGVSVDKDALGTNKWGY